MSRRCSHATCAFQQGRRNENNCPQCTWHVPEEQKCFDEARKKEGPLFGPLSYTNVNRRVRNRGRYMDPFLFVAAAPLLKKSFRCSGFVHPAIHHLRRALSGGVLPNDPVTCALLLDEDLPRCSSLPGEIQIIIENEFYH